MTFLSQLETRWAVGRHLCIGLDPESSYLPESLVGRRITDALRDWLTGLVEATSDYAAAYKPNAAYYEQYGPDGMALLRDVIDYIHQEAPGVPVILDAKRGDVEHTNAAYARALFDAFAADAATVNPYLGLRALEPFLERQEKGVIILCRTSNAGAGEFQDVSTQGSPLFERVARIVSTEWNTRGNCGLLTGATWPDELRAVRQAAPHLPFLVPGLGAQGGSVSDVVAAGRTSNGGLILSASRSIMLASQGEDWAEAAAKAACQLHDEIVAAMAR